MQLSKIAAIGCLFLVGCGSGRVASRHDSASTRALPSAPTAQSAPVVAAKARPSMQEPIAALGIQPDEYPPLGSCRVWMSGTPAGQQQPPCSCFSLIMNVPAGAMVLYRPTSDKSVLQVTKYHSANPNKIVSTDLYDVKSGKYLRSKKL